MTEYMIVRGTGESLNSNLPTAFMRPLLGPGDTLTQVDYPASIGPANPTPNTWGPSMEKSLNLGLEALVAAVRRTPNIPVLVGYSLGAYVISRFLENLAAGKYPDLQVAGAIQIASPRAPLVNGREGLARAHGRYSVPVCDIRNYWDMICNTPSDSPLMKITGLVAIGTLGVPDGFDVWNWVSRELLRASAPPSLGDLRLVEGYLPGGNEDHTRPYLADPVFRRAAAQWMDRQGFRTR